MAYPFLLVVIVLVINQQDTPLFQIAPYTRNEHSSEPDEEILIKFDRDALQDYFGTDFGSEKLFVVKVGDSFKRSKEEAIKRAHKVLFDGPRYKNRVIEFIPEIDAYRIFRNSSVRMFWDLSIVNPLEVKKENVNENSLMSYCQIWCMALKRRSCLIDR